MKNPRVFLLAVLVVIGSFVAYGAVKAASGNSATVKTTALDEIMSQ